MTRLSGETSLSQRHVREYGHRWASRVRQYSHRATKYVELPLTRRQRQKSSLLRGRLQRTLVRGEGRLGAALTLNLIRQEDCNLRITVSTLPK
jgi:hypothetical protein